jgi:hypothetical protein
MVRAGSIGTERASGVCSDHDEDDDDRRVVVVVVEVRYAHSEQRGWGCGISPHDPSLAGISVDPHHSLLGAADVFRSDNNCPKNRSRIRHQSE